MQNSNRIQRLSRIMVWACSLFLVLMPALALWVWLDFERFAAGISQDTGLRLQMEYIGPMNLLLAGATSMIPLALLLYGIWRLRQLFSLYRTGVYFSDATAGHLHSFATMLFFSTLLSLISGALVSVFLTMSNPPGERSLMLNFGTDDLYKLLIAAVFLSIAWVMREAQRLATENAEFI